MSKTSNAELTPTYYTVYRITNKVNGKVYVGKHKTTDLKDRYLGSGKMLKRALTKYGRENFEKEILFIFLTEDEMNEKEKELVTEEFCSRDDTYNMCVGGQGGFSMVNRKGLNNSGKDMQAIGAKISRKLVGRTNPAASGPLRERHRAGLIRYDTRTGQCLSEEHKRAISEAGKKNIGPKNSQFGTCWVHIDDENKKVRIEDLEQYLRDGYMRGKAKAARPTRVCCECSLEFEIPPRAKQNRMYCSRSCSDRAKVNKDGLSQRELNTLAKRRERARKRNTPT